MKRVRYMTREDGRSVEQIQAELPNLFIWKMAKTGDLPEDDKEILVHPNRWETGYPALLLSKYFKVSKMTIRDYVTWYNRSIKPID